MIATALSPFVTSSLFLILVVATVGCVAALRGWREISADRKKIRRAEITLTADESWEGAYPHDKLLLATWLREKGIKPDSHIGDFIRTSWSAWLGGRPASLTELHVLVARRERSRGSVRLSAGIAALLLVFGIVGTLSSIKPVLAGFEFHVSNSSSSRVESDSPDFSSNDVEVANTTERVNELIHNLGNAFWPSLFALVGTIVVVSCRGLYSLELHKFTLELDGFAVDTLIPRYRVPSLSEQYHEVKASLVGISEGILQRETGFQEVVVKLESLVKGLSPALSGLEAATKSSDEAADRLSSRAQSITDGLTRHLGAKSPMYQAVSGFEGIMERTEQTLTRLATLVEGIDQSNAQSLRHVETAIQKMNSSIGSIANDHQAHQSDAKKALSDFTQELAGLPDVIKGASEKSVQGNLAAVKSSIELLSKEQKEWHRLSSEQLKGSTEAGLKGVLQAGKDLSAQAGKVNEALAEVRGLESSVKSAIKQQSEEGKTQIQQIGEVAKSAISSAAGEISRHTRELGSALVESRSQAPPADGGISSKRGKGASLNQKPTLPSKGFETTSRPEPAVSQDPLIDDVPQHEEESDPVPPVVEERQTRRLPEIRSVADQARPAETPLVDSKGVSTESTEPPVKKRSWNPFGKKR